MAAIVFAGWLQVGFSQSLNDGLVAYYPFNGNANDESGNGNHGIVNGVTLAKDRHGESDKAYKFDGNDYIKVTHNSKLNAGNNFSLSVWYTVEGPSSNDYGTIVGKDGRNSGWWLSTARSGNTTTKIRWEHVSVGGIIENKTFSYSPVTWHHSVIVYNNRNASFYLDNQLLEEKKLTNSSGLSSSDLLIGQQFSGISGRGWKGKIDDVRIYNRALSKNEVADLYEKPKDDLVLYYPFNGNANDESGNGNNGTVINATLVDGLGNESTGAYRFDGRNSKISGSKKLIGLKNATASFWFKGDEKNQHSQRVNLITTASFRVFLQNMPDNHVHHGHKIYVAIPEDRNATKVSSRLYERLFVPNFIKGEWNHIVVKVFENNSCSLIMNGKVIPVQSTNTDYPDSEPDETYVGQFDGTLDNVRIYNQALSVEKVEDLYELEKPETVIPPQITAISENTVADEGETIELTVVADGVGPLLYSWKKTGSNLELSNTTNLVLINVDEGDTGSYYVVVSNEGGKSESATVEIDIRPDTDNDGLLDHEEIAIGSDINKVDSDGDGLSDFDEVDIFSTSPIRPDTDGDGLDDGSEIRGGFDPREPTESADGSISIKVAVELEFFTLTWNNYQLQRSKDVIKWQDVDAPFKGVGGYSSIFQTARKDKIYWRLKIID